MRQEHVSSSVEQTEQIAIELSRSLAGGECIALEGELGAGKTQFVRGLLRGLGGELAVAVRHLSLARDPTPPRRPSW